MNLIKVESEEDSTDELNDMETNECADLLFA
jgi:hypothetical protein